MPTQHTHTHFLHELKGGSPGKFKSGDLEVKRRGFTSLSTTLETCYLCTKKNLLYQWKFSTLDPSSSDKGPEQVVLRQIW
jgi:hypothetical protein